MSGGQIKDILEDVCDNLFNADPYHQQGGDMVWIGGFTYSCTPTRASGGDFDVKLHNGDPLEAGGRATKFAGWASVNEQQGKPMCGRLRQASRLREEGGNSRGTSVTLKVSNAIRHRRKG